MARVQRWQQPTLAIAAADDDALRRIVATAESGGFRVVMNSSLERGAGRPTLMLVAVRSTRDWEVLDRLVRAEQQVVVFLPNPDPEHIRRAWTSGAMGVLTDDTPPAQIVDALRAARKGHALVSVALLRRVLAPSWTSLPASDRRLLEQLSTPLTVAEIAESEDCSERTLYRRIQRLYARLQVSGRREAVELWLRTGAQPVEALQA